MHLIFFGKIKQLEQFFSITDFQNKKKTTELFPLNASGCIRVLLIRFMNLGDGEQSLLQPYR